MKNSMNSSAFLQKSSVLVKKIGSVGLFKNIDDNPVSELLIDKTILVCSIDIFE